MLRFLALALGFSLFAGTAFAVDTSGCSPLKQQSQQVSTVQGRLLTVTSFQALQGSCWNTNQTHIEISYQWLQEISAVENTAQIWLKINEREGTLNLTTSCAASHDQMTYEKNTSGKTIYRCSGTATVAVKPGALRVEVAPVVNGAWDTHGFGQNYIFNF